MKKILYLFMLLMVFSPLFSRAQEVHDNYRGTWRAKVTEVILNDTREVPGTGTNTIFQKIEAEVLEGPIKGREIIFENDYLELKEGQKFYFNYYVDINGAERFGLTNIDRRESLLFIVLIFIFTVIVFGGWQGVRSLLALFGSFVAIFYALIPGLVHGWNPIVASSLVASVVLFVAIFFTHGFNRESLVAYTGTMLAVIITGIFAYFAVDITSLTGILDDEAVYLNFNTKGTLDFTGLLLGAIVIGILGVLDDIAVTQSAVVSELYDSNPNISRGEVYKRAIRIGREHVGALVNTLVLAYTGASLPILLYLYTSELTFKTVINLEVFSTEVVRAVVGSIGLILTVPIVTFLAVVYLKGYKSKNSHSHIHHHH